MSWNMKKRSFRAELKSLRKHHIWVQLPKNISECKFKAENATVNRKNDMLEVCMEKGGNVIIY